MFLCSLSHYVWVEFILWLLYATCVLLLTFDLLLWLLSSKCIVFNSKLVHLLICRVILFLIYIYLWLPSIPLLIVEFSLMSNPLCLLIEIYSFIFFTPSFMVRRLLLCDCILLTTFSMPPVNCCSLFALLSWFLSTKFLMFNFFLLNWFIYTTTLLVDILSP